MTNRQLDKIVNFYKSGVTIEVCIAIIMDLLKNDPSPLNKGIWIHSFYEQIFNLDNKKQIENYGKSMIIKEP